MTILCTYFKQIDPSVQVELLDISGRQPGDVPNPGDSKRLSWIRHAENHFPGLFSLMNAIIQTMRTRRRIHGPWQAVLKNSCALIIGGGQMLQDNQLGFPVKLFHLVRAARRLGIPTYITACGVGEKVVTRCTRTFLKRAAKRTCDHCS